MKQNHKAQVGRKRLVGSGLSPGQAVGTAYRIELQAPSFYRLKIARSEVEVELDRLRQALARCKQQYLVDKEKFEAVAGKEFAYIIEAHMLMLEDPQFLEEIERRIREELDSPEKAVRYVGEKLLSLYHSLEDPFFRERGSDLEEVIERLVVNLMELTPQREEVPCEDAILVASEIGLSVFAQYPLEQIKGMVLQKAGTTSHVAIIARSYQIPVVTGIKHLRKHIQTGDLLIVDGSAGTVEVGASRQVVAEVLDKAQRVRKVEAPGADEPHCETADGERVYLYGNTEIITEVPAALALGAEGIGLFRSEYLYMKQNREEIDEDHHFKVYHELASLVGERLAVIRTLDIAGSRGSVAGVRAGEEDAALGLRGVRYSLKHTNIFRAQLRAIIRASRAGNLRIVLPMVSSVDEMIEARSIIAELEQQEGVSDSIKVGVLLEVPAAVLTLDSLVPYVDFFEVGTNDLIQYLLAAGRRNEEICYLYSPLHPAVLNLLNQISNTARQHQVETLVCGEMAANPHLAAILVGMGFDRLSMAPFAIPEVKTALRAVSSAALKEKVKQLLGIASPLEMEAFVRKQFRNDDESEKPDQVVLVN